MTNNTIYQLNEQFIFDPKLRFLQDMRDDGDRVWLGNNEASLLLTFIDNANLIVTKTQLHNAVWLEHGLHVDDSSVIQSISLLRKYLRDSAKKPIYIKTVSKKGYLFIGVTKVLRTETKPEHNTTITQASPETTIEYSTGLEKKKKVSHLLTSMYSLVSLAAIFLIFTILVTKYSNDFEYFTTINDIDIEIPKKHRSSKSQNDEMITCLTNLFSTQMPKNTKRVIVNLDPSENITLSIIHRQETLNRTLSVISSGSIGNLPCQSNYIGTQL